MNLLDPNNKDTTSKVGIQPLGTLGQGAVNAIGKAQQCAASLSEEQR